MVDNVSIEVEQKIPLVQEEDEEIYAFYHPRRWEKIDEKENEKEDTAIEID